MRLVHLVNAMLSLVDTNMPAPHNTKAFAAGLLDPKAQKPNQVRGPEGKAAEKRYNVYRNNVTVSLIDAVADIFPAVQKITGQDYFRAMAREYVRARPPSSPLLFLYGQDFAEFIENFEPAKTMPYLADVARVERGWLTAYHAADIKPLDADKLGQIDPNRLADIRFKAHPATFVLQSHFPVHDIFLMNKDFMPVAPIDLQNAQSIMLTRPQADTRLIDLQPADATFINAIISEQKTLGEAAELAMQTNAEFNLNQAISMLLGSGATQAIILNDPTHEVPISGENT